MEMPDNNREQEGEILEAPAELISALKRCQAPVFIPRTVDEAILGAASRHLSQQTARGIEWWLMIRWALAAVALVFLLTLIAQLLRKSGPTSGSGGVQRDLSHEGQIDIMDAFTLARELRSGVHPGPQWDINGDGVVDERDVQALAARAVSLGKGGRS